MIDLDFMKLREIAERAQDGGSWSGKIEPESYPESDDADLPFVVKDEQNRLVAYLPEHYSDRYRPYEADGEYIATFDPPTILALILRAEGALAAEEDHHNRFWLILHEPGCVPKLKGPWKGGHQAAILREFMTALPTAYIDVLSVSEIGPLVQHGPEVLQMLDGRSMARGRRHNAQTREAHAAHHAARPPTPAPAAEPVAISRDEIERLTEDAFNEGWRDREAKPSPMINSRGTMRTAWIDSNAREAVLATLKGGHA